MFRPFLKLKFQYDNRVYTLYISIYLSLYIYIHTYTCVWGRDGDKMQINEDKSLLSASFILRLN